MDEVLAIAVTVVHTIGDGRQVSFQTAMAADMSTDKKNALLDDLVALGERQKVKAERPELVKDLVKHQEILAQYREDMQRLEADFPAKKAALEEALADLQDPTKHDAATAAFLETMAPDLLALRVRRTDEFNAGYAAWIKTPGHQGEYRPRGHVEANLARLDKAIEQAEETIKAALVDFETEHQRKIETAQEAVGNAAAERDFALQQLAISEKRYLQAIEGLELRLTEIDKILGG